MAPAQNSPLNFNLLHFRDAGGATGGVSDSVSIAAPGLADSLLHNYTIAGSMSNRSGLEADPVADEEEWLQTLLLVLQATIMVSIIVAAIFGNLLVIASVMRHRKLR